MKLQRPVVIVDGKVVPGKTTGETAGFRVSPGAPASGRRPMSEKRSKPALPADMAQAKWMLKDKQPRIVTSAMRLGVKSKGEPIYIGPASNLTGFAKVGPIWVKLVLDTGAARSIIRTRVSKGLAESELSKKAVLRRVPIKNNVCCEGIEQGKKFPPLEDVVYLSLALVGYAPGSPEKVKEVKVEVMACELAESSEPLIIGLSDLSQWGECLWNPQRCMTAPLGTHDRT